MKLLPHGILLGAVRVAAVLITYAQMLFVFPCLHLICSIMYDIALTRPWLVKGHWWGLCVTPAAGIQFQA